METPTFSIEKFKQRQIASKDKPQPRNSSDDVKEQIWESITSKNPKANRKMFFIKTGGVPVSELLSFRKWADTTDNFCRAFYGALKNYHLKK